MTLEERLELLRGGYTKDEIEKMNSDSSVESSTNVDNQNEISYDVDDEEVENNSSNENQPNPSSEIDGMKNEFKTFMDGIQKEMKETIQAMQKYNQQHDRMRVVEKEDAEDILAKIINPPLKNNERYKGEK